MPTPHAGCLVRSSSALQPPVALTVHLYHDITVLTAECARLLLHYKCRNANRLTEIIFHLAYKLTPQLSGPKNCPKLLELYASTYGNVISFPIKLSAKKNHILF